MNGRADAQLLGWLLLALAGLELLPLGVALLAGEPLAPWVLGAAAPAAFGVSTVASTQAGATDAGPRLGPRDGILVVGLGWLLVSGFGALPYFLSESLGGSDALFESVAGFTTTAVTALPDVEAAPRSILLWRSLTQWVGGIGIVLFTIALLPLLPAGGMQLFKAELPAAVSDAVAPRIAETARRLGLVYGALTAAAALAFATVGGMPLFDAVCHGLTTVSTGGFSTRNASLGAFAPAAQWVAIAFMLLAGANLVVIYRLAVRRDPRPLRADGELHYYLAALAIAGALVVGSLAASASEGGTALRDGVFQTVSMLSGTGYHTAGFADWPPLTRWVLFNLMLAGGMAGSTAGGLKSLRVLLMLRALRVAVARLLHPHAVRSVKYGGRPVPEEVLGSVWAFLPAYLLLVLAAAAALAAAGHDVETALSAGASVVGNVGPAFGELGPGAHFGDLAGPVKLALCGAMLLGRLEIFPLLVLGSPGFWRR